MDQPTENIEGFVNGHKHQEAEMKQRRSIGKDDLQQGKILGGMFLAGTC